MRKERYSVIEKLLSIDGFDHVVEFGPSEITTVEKPTIFYFINVNKVNKLVYEYSVNLKVLTPDKPFKHGCFDGVKNPQIGHMLFQDYLIDLFNIDSGVKYDAIGKRITINLTSISNIVSIPTIKAFSSTIDFSFIDLEDI